MYGLTQQQFFIIINILKKFSKDIEWAKIFGSRARGDFKNYSDIDMAFKFRNKIANKLLSEFSESNLPFKVDVIDYAENKNDKLKNYIDNEGKIVFLTNKEGMVMMNINKIKDKYEDYKKALKKLTEALSVFSESNELYLDATIQRFEFTYELSWKIIKAWLEYNGITGMDNPRSCFREGAKSGLIADIDKWFEMIEDRNKTSHTYNEEIALGIYKKIKNDYIGLFEKLKENLKYKIEEL